MHNRPTPPPRRRRWHVKRLIGSTVIIAVVLTYSLVVVNRPFKNLKPVIGNNSLSITTPTSDLPWPDYSQGAFGLASGKVISTHGEQIPLPIASAAKVVTALVVLERHPISGSASGPTITLRDSDVAIYNTYVALHGSVLPVSSGQKLSERDMLEALLLPSANNIADSLAIWSFGSVDNYLTAANTYLAKHQLTESHVGGDASGFLPASTSTTRDLVKLGALAMQQPIIASIVGQKTAQIPGVGTVRNVDTLVGSNNIVGIKTGNNDQNGGVFIGASTVQVNGTTTTLITALSGAPSLNRVLSDSATLLAAARTTIASTTIVSAGSVLGSYHDANGKMIQAAAARDLNITVLRGDSVTARVQLQPISYKARRGQTVGSVSVPASAFASAQSVPVILKQTPDKPSIMYRLLHP